MCAPCPAGKFSDALTSRCSLCMAGYARARNGGASCAPCAAGRFVRSPGAARCNRCRWGKYSPGGETRCHYCARGRYGAGGSTSPSCDGPCAAGRFGHFPSPTAQCDGWCDAGHFGRPGKGATTAVCSGACPPGRAAPKRGASACTACTAGRFSSAAGAVACERCPRGTVATAGGAVRCVHCRRGQHSSTSASCSPDPTPPPTPSPTPSLALGTSVALGVGGTAADVVAVDGGGDGVGMHVSATALVWLLARGKPQSLTVHTLEAKSQLQRAVLVAIARQLRLPARSVSVRSLSPLMLQRRGASADSAWRGVRFDFVVSFPSANELTYAGRVQQQLAVDTVHSLRRPGFTSGLARALARSAGVGLAVQPCALHKAAAADTMAVCTLPTHRRSTLGTTAPRATSPVAMPAHTGRVQPLSTKTPTPAPAPESTLQSARSNSSFAASPSSQSKVLRLESAWAHTLGLSPASLMLCALCVAALGGAGFRHACDKRALPSRDHAAPDQPVVPLASISHVPKAAASNPGDDWDGLLANDNEAVPFASTSAAGSFNTMSPSHGHEHEPGVDHDSV